MSEQSLKVEIYVHLDATGIKIPEYKTPGSVGMDLEVSEDVTIPPRGFVDVKHGINIGAPPGKFFFVMARSSLFKRGLIMPLGLIDTDYRGEIFSPVFNISDEPVHIKAGDRISQIVFGDAVNNVTWHRCATLNDLSKTERGAGGFGSTG